MLIAVRFQGSTHSIINMFSLLKVCFLCDKFGIDRSINVQCNVFFLLCCTYLQLQRSYNRFLTFYTTQHNGRKLNWLYKLSKVSTFVCVCVCGEE